MEYLDREGFDVEDGQGGTKRISLRETGGRLSVDTVGNRHRLQTYSTLDHQQHRLVGQEFETEVDAQNAIDAHNRSIKTGMFEKNETPISDSELDRYAKRAEERTKEAEARTSNHIIFTDY